MLVRKLNTNGLREFSKFIDNLRSGLNQNIPLYMLEDAEFSEPLEISLSIENMPFRSRYEMGYYLVDRLKNLNIQNYIGDQGFWSWFSLFWFDQLCPAEAGIRKPRKDYNYILSKNYNHRPRHAIYMTWQLVSKYGESARFLLSKPPSTRGEIVEQMMARQEILTSEGAVLLASYLYYDKNIETFKKGAASRKSPGCISRYISWLQQLQVTYDIFSISKDDLLDLLPQEFDRFRET